MNLYEFVRDHAIRGACQCGKCIDAPPNPEKLQPIGHTADLIFFKVALKKVMPETEMKNIFIELIKKEYPHWLNGEEHNYLNMGAEVGDQGLAMMTMGMGKLLNVWELQTPASMLGSFITEELKMQMAGIGYISIKAQKETIDGKGEKEEKEV